MDGEIWKEFRWGYTVSNMGRIRNPRGCEMSPRADRVRPTVQLRDGNRRETHQIAAMVLEAFWQPKPAGMMVGFRDDDTMNARLENLYWVDASCAPRYDAGPYKSGGERPSIMEFPLIDLKGVAPQRVQERVQAERYDSHTIHKVKRADGMPQLLIPWRDDRMVPVTLPRVGGFFE